MWDVINGLLAKSLGNERSPEKPMYIGGILCYQDLKVLRMFIMMNLEKLFSLDPVDVLEIIALSPYPAETTFECGLLGLLEFNISRTA